MTVSQFSRALPLLALLAAASAAEAKPHRKSHVGARVPHRPHRKAVADPPDKSGAEPPPVVIRKQVAGPVEEVQIDLDRQRAIVGDPTPVMVTVRPRDAAGRATDAEVSIDSDFGEVGEPVRREQGVYSAPLTLRSNLGGSAVRSVLIMVRANRVGGHATLTLEPGPPASVRVEAPESIRADGVTTFQMDITVHDAFGHPAH